MQDFNRRRVISNYYIIVDALSTICTIENLPTELLELSVSAATATNKIITYIKDHEDEHVDSDTDVDDYDFKRCMK